MTKVSILGATGYAGAELVKLILQHPNATLTHITSESHTGKPWPMYILICEALPI